MRACCLCILFLSLFLFCTVYLFFGYKVMIDSVKAPQSPALGKHGVLLYNRQHSRGQIVTNQLDATVQCLQNLFPLRISNCV